MRIGEPGIALRSLARQAQAARGDESRPLAANCLFAVVCHPCLRLRSQGLDARWQSWAALTEQQVLVANFANNSDWCGPTTRNQFAFQGFAGDHSPLNCADSDAQCLGVINRTRCSKLLSYSNPAQASVASKPTLYFIREVGWKHDCASDRKTFLLGIRGLAAIPENQRTVTIINIASNTVNILLLLLVLAEIFVFPCIWEGRKYDPTK